MNPVPGAAMKALKITEPWFNRDEQAAVADVLASGQLVQADRVAEFECLVAAEVGLAHVVMVSSGTAALHLTLLACGIGPGDAVAVPDFSFVATANAVSLTGATPVFVDVRPDTYNMDPSSLRTLIARMNGPEGRGGPVLKMIMPVHQFGLVGSEIETVAEIADEHGLGLVEDAACALGSRYHDRQAGAWGIASCFSFHPRKVITTGEGGAIVTKDWTLAERLRALRAHGFAAPSGQPELMLKGLNYRMTEIQAALGICQMKKLPEILKRRCRLATVMHQQLEGVGWFTRPAVPPNAAPNWQSYVGVLAAGCNRARIIERLAERGIEARSPATAIHRLGVYRFGRRSDPDTCPVSAMLDARALALPFHPLMEEADVKRVATELRELGPG